MTDDFTKSLEETLTALQGQTIIIDAGSVLGPEEDARAFQASKDSAKQTILALHTKAVVEARIEELKDIGKFWQTRTGEYQNENAEQWRFRVTDFVIDRIQQLEAQLSAKEDIE